MPAPDLKASITKAVERTPFYPDDGLPPVPYDTQGRSFTSEPV